MGIFKPAYVYDSLKSYMADRYDVYSNKYHRGISKSDLMDWLVELEVRFKKSASRDELFRDLFDNGITVIDCYERFPHFYAVTKNDYVQRFNITDSEYNRLKRTNFLKVVSKIQNSSNGITGFDAKQFFEMTEEELRLAIPDLNEEKAERLKKARIKGLTCVRCGEVQSHYSQINKDKVCSICEEKERVATRMKLYSKLCKEFLNSSDHVILDTETTGLNRWDEVIELAILDMQGNVLYESLFNPLESIPEGATWIHGITNEMVQNSPSFLEEWETIWSILKDKTVLIYNSRFDVNMIYQTLERSDLLFCEDTFKSFCMMEFFKDYIDSRRWVKLSDACETMGVEVEQNHRAADDCRMVLELIKAIANKH